MEWTGLQRTSPCVRTGDGCGVVERHPCCRDTSAYLPSPSSAASAPPHPRPSPLRPPHLGCFCGHSSRLGIHPFRPQYNTSCKPFFLPVTTDQTNDAAPHLCLAPGQSASQPVRSGILESRVALSLATTDCIPPAAPAPASFISTHRTARRHSRSLAHSLVLPLRFRLASAEEFPRQAGQTEVTSHANPRATTEQNRPPAAHPARVQKTG
ncbi:hypothetical protein IWZ01DRAFT_123909 [Phyllosticta capitalensis]